MRVTDVGLSAGSINNGWVPVLNPRNGTRRLHALTSALLPPVMAFNVNFPEVLDGAKWRHSSIEDRCERNGHRTKVKPQI